jgi:class 3 adenylate cyclase/tetratricopeptide (TPR) repeat protein
VTVEADGSARCPSCGFENRKDARYCGACGADLTIRTCSSCEAENPPANRFCDRCGAALADAPGEGAPTRAVSPGASAGAPTPAAARAGAPESIPGAEAGLALPEHLSRKARESAASLAGERKQVTVLFADVTGSMDLAEQTDPERWRAIMDRFFRILADAVYRFEGTVDKFTGDGIMAIFGAPIAHEDHAQRACFAALEMQKGVSEYAGELRRTEGISLTARVGINSGEVVVGAIGDDLSLSYTAVGHTVGLAQRMEALAEPGKVYATERTAELAAGFLELADLGEFEIKGSSRPVKAFEVVGVGTARTRLDVARGRGLTRFVGRAAEMRELEGALAATQDDDGQVIGIVAEPGVGKSRLCAEFVESVRARDIEVHEAHCQAHGRNLPLMPVLEILRSYFRIDDRDSPREAREKIAGRMLLLDPGLAEELPLLFDFLGVPDPARPAPRMDAEARRRQLLDVVRKLVGAKHRPEPVVNLVEDAHWMDPASEEFLAALIEGVPNTPTLVLVNFRPEYSAEWMRRSWYRQLPLASLGDEAVGELLAELLGTDPSLDGLAEMVRDRTGGNPFYIEEVVRELAESGALEGEPAAYRLVRQIDELALPRSVQSILAARIDRLGAAAKEVLGAAAVIGKDFGREVVARVADLDGERIDEALRELVAAEFIAEMALYPEPEYTFRHPLTREVALGSQLVERRAATHRRVAEAIQEQEPERLDELAALVAQHYDEAGGALEAAGWYMRAALWSRMNDQPTTLAHLERIREIDRQLPDDPDVDGLRAVSRGLLVNIGWRGGMAESEVREIFEEGLAAARRTRNLAAVASLHAALAAALGIMGRVPEGVRHGAEALTNAEVSGEPEILAMARTASSYPQFISGEIEGALQNVEALIELTRDDPARPGLGIESPYAWAVAFRTLPLVSMGRFREALDAAVEGEETARRHGFDETLGWVHSFRLAYEHWSGSRDGSVALAHGRSGLEIAQRIGSSFSLVVALTWLGEAHRIAGEPEEAIEALEQALERIERSRAGFEFEVWGRWLYCRALTDAGDPGRGVEQGALAAELGRERGVRVIEPGARIAEAQARLARGAGEDIAAAVELLTEAEAIAEEIGAVCNRLQILDGRARIAAARGEEAARTEALEAGLETARAMGATGWEERFAELLGAGERPRTS